MSTTYAVQPAEQLFGSLSAEWREFAERPDHRVEPKVVLADGKPVAIGSMARNLLHPEPRYFRFLVDDSADPICLTLLLDELLANLGPEGQRPIHFSESESNSHIAGWAETAGFRPIIRTWMGVLMPGTPLAAPSYRFNRLSERDTPGLRHSLAALHSQIYRAQHHWNPPAPITPEMAVSLFLDESELIPEYLWYSVDEANRPIGVVSLRRTRAPQVLELGWLGVLDGVDGSVLRALFDTALSAVGNRALNIEVDENQELVRRYVSELPVHWHKVIVRYERPAAI